MIYSQINDVGKQWVRKYTLVRIAKELLGAVREKVFNCSNSWFGGKFGWCLFRVKSTTNRKRPVD